MFNSIKCATQQNGLRFFSNRKIKIPQVLYVSIESQIRDCAGLYNSPQTARELSRNFPGVTLPTALARTMLHDIFKYIEQAIAWKNVAYPGLANLITIIATPEGTFHTPPGDEFMMTQEVFHRELILPIKEHMKKFTSQVGLNLGTFGVLVSSADENFDTCNYRIQEFPSAAGSIWLNQEPKVPHKFMHAAIHGTGGTKPIVDYYTKRNVWHGDNYKDQLLQVYDKSKPTILIRTVDDKEYARVLKICLDSAYNTSEAEMNDLLIQIGVEALPNFGHMELVSRHGTVPDRGDIFYNRVLMSEGHSDRKSGTYDMTKDPFTQYRNRTDKRESLYIPGQLWPIDAHLFPYHPTELGQKLVLEPEIDLTTKLSSFLKGFFP